MTPAIAMEILDLRHFSAGNLKPVLEAEGRIWNDRLSWDFRSSANLLLQYLDSRLLPGLVAMSNGRVRGYTFCVYEASKAVLGDVFAMDSGYGPGSAAEVEQRLIEHIVELLQNSPGVDRIESQLLLHSHGTHTATLKAAGFRVFERLFMELDLRPSAASLSRRDVSPPPGKPATLELREWREGDFSAAGQLISQAYRGHLDSLINDQYRTPAGSLRFLHNIVRFPGCGVFDAAASRVLVDRAHGEMVGLLLCSRVRQDVAHVTQLCVARDYRRRGLGALMLTECANCLETRGFSALTLTVTEQNTGAVSLYRSRGFVPRHTFDAMVWDKSTDGV